MSLLGDDGRGYELARKLETLEIWRTWLGESCYGIFAPYLNSPTTWEAFMRVDESKSKSQMHLQFRVRALLFDKSLVSLSLPSKLSSSYSISKLNPTYLQLHGDDVYFTLENSSSSSSSLDVPSNSASSLIQSKGAFGAGPRYRESENENIHQRCRNEVFPESWYNQFIEKFRMTRPYKLSLGEQELVKRSPGSMSTYLRISEKNKKRRVAFKEDPYMGYGNSNLSSDGGSSDDGESLFLPEVMFALNSVPDSALHGVNRVDEKPKIKFYGVLESLPRMMMTRSAASIERFGLNPYLGMEQGGNSFHGRSESVANKKSLGHDQASLLSQKVIARMMINMGFEGSTEVPVEVFSQLMSFHIMELGRIMKVLSDSYRKQCSAVELIKMFVQNMKCDFGSLVEHVKDVSRASVQQSQQQVHGVEMQMTAQAQVALRLQQQMSRQLHPQMPQFAQPQNLAYQQQQQMLQQQQQQQMLQQLRRRQPATPRPSMDMEKDRASPMVQVKIEQHSELPMDATAFNSFNARYNQMHFRQQQLASMSNFGMSNVHNQSANQFRPMASVQIPQMQTQNIGGVVRAPPVKVEGFQDLMSGDASSKHDSDGNRLTSPSSK